MIKTCPQCGITNSPDSLKCDCGYCYPPTDTSQFNYPDVSTQSADALRPYYIQFVISWILLFFGLVMLVFFLIFPIRTPETDLTVVEGVPTEATLTTTTTRGTNSYFIDFTVDGFKTEYGSSHPKYEQVLAAVRSGQPLRMWVSTKQETLFPRAGWVPLYGLQVGDKVILTYNDVVSDEEKSGVVGFVCPGFLIFVALIGIGTYYRVKRKAVSHP